jgi:RNA polymerase sigma-70 factor (ECF subfamily)
MTAPRPPVASTEALWQGLRSRLVAFVQARTSSRQDAEDIVQDVFLRMHLALEQGAAIERLDAFMFRIARNALIDQYRRVGAREGRTLEWPEEEDEGELAALRASLAECIGPFLDRLPEPYAQALRWVDRDGLTQAEAAEQAGISVSGMKSRVQRGRAKLHELLEVCCRFELDCRGRVIAYEARSRCGCEGE